MLERLLWMSYVDCYLKGKETVFLTIHSHRKEFKCWLNLNLFILIPPKHKVKISLLLGVTIVVGISIGILVRIIGMKFQGALLLLRFS